MGYLYSKSHTIDMNSVNEILDKTYTIFKLENIDENMPIKELSDKYPILNEDRKNNDERMSNVSKKVAFWDKFFTKQGCPKETIRTSSQNNKAIVARKTESDTVEEKTKEENIEVSIDTQCEFNMTPIVPKICSETMSADSSGDVHSKNVSKGQLLDKKKFETLTETAKLALKQALKQDAKVIDKFKNEFLEK